MKILYYFKEKDYIMDQWQRAHIFHELAQHGIQIEVFNPLKYASIEIANEELIKHIIANPNFDLFMTPHGQEDIYIETVQAINKLGYPSLLICFDNLMAPFMHEKVASKFDLVWLTSAETEYIFKGWNARTIVQPYAANPYIYKPKWGQNIAEVVFVGSPYGSRANIINNLTMNNQVVSLYGKYTIANDKIEIQPINFNKPLSSIKEIFIPQVKVDFDWTQNQAIPYSSDLYKMTLPKIVKSAYNLSRYPIGRRTLKAAFIQKINSNAKLENNQNLKVYGSIEPDRLSYIYSNYSLSLASTHSRNTGVLDNPVHIINLRSFEIPMSGGLQFCSYFEELASYFTEDKEIIFYRSPEEQVEKARFYTQSKNQSLVQIIKEAAYLRCLNEHTWYHRFNNVFSALGIKN